VLTLRYYNKINAKKGWRKEGGFLINLKEDKSLKTFIKNIFIPAGSMLKIAITNEN